jgi:hypothetical protein
MANARSGWKVKAWTRPRKTLALGIRTTRLTTTPSFD